MVIPAGRSLSWRISAPVRADVADPAIDVSARASHQGATLSQTGNTTLVLLRNGFDTAATDHAVTATQH